MTTPLGDRLRIARKAFGLSQEALAHHIGIARVNYNLIERGKTRDPAVSIVCRLAIALDRSMDELMGLPVRQE